MEPMDWWKQALFRSYKKTTLSPGLHLSLPVAGHIYAIGDIHGCFPQFKNILEQIFEDAQNLSGGKVIVTVGDYVDRGPFSYSAIEELLESPPEGFSRVWLRGNHEAMMLDACDTGSIESWLSVGGSETLASYGISADNLLAMNRKTRKQVMASFIPKTHIDFLRSMPLFVTVGDYLFVHAGVRPGVPLKRQKEQDLLWIREPFLSTDHGLPYTVVHGHTPGPEVVQTPYRIGLDTHAYAGGKLSAVRLSPGEEPKFFSA